ALFPAHPSALPPVAAVAVAAVGGDPNTRWRLAYWKELLRRTAHEPAFGVGFGKPAAFTWHGVLYDARVPRGGDEFNVTDPHNSFVDILYRTGLVGFVP